jgi:hypothetical protein
MRALVAILLISVFAIEAETFKVLSFYSGTYDAAHIAFVKEANPWFSKLASQNNFQFESTNDWNRLHNINASQYQVVFFLDDHPSSASQHAGFQHYMENGGGWFGFHVSAFNTNPNDWSWYFNTFLGNGAFVSNTWFPTKATLKIENREHPSTKRLPDKVTSMVSEWYSWHNDLRKNSNINILASVDPSSFPLGTDPNQSWHSGYYPIMWTNKNYKMIYANFGHNAMDYAKNIQTSSTFDSSDMDKFILDSILWLGGALK